MPFPFHIESCMRCSLHCGAQISIVANHRQAADQVCVTHTAECLITHVRNVPHAVMQNLLFPLLECTDCHCRAQTPPHPHTHTPTLPHFHTHTHRSTWGDAKMLFPVLGCTDSVIAVEQLMAGSMQLSRSKDMHACVDRRNPWHTFENQGHTLKSTLLTFDTVSGHDSV